MKFSIAFTLNKFKLKINVLTWVNLRVALHFCFDFWYHTFQFQELVYNIRLLYCYLASSNKQYQAWYKYWLNIDGHLETVVVSFPELACDSCSLITFHPVRRKTKIMIRMGQILMVPWKQKFSGNIKFHINSVSIQYQFNLHDQFFLIFFKTKLLMINLKMEHCGAFYAPSYHMC